MDLDVKSWFLGLTKILDLAVFQILFFPLKHFFILLTMLLLPILLMKLPLPTNIKFLIKNSFAKVLNIKISEKAI